MGEVAMRDAGWNGTSASVRTTARMSLPFSVLSVSLW